MNISKKRLDRIRKISDKSINYTDIPELDDNFWKEAKFVEPKKKVPVSLRLDEDVVNWFKKKGQGYQTRINAILSAYIKSVQSTKTV